MTLSEDIIRFIEGLTLTQGRKAGEQFILDKWQKRFIHKAFSVEGDAAISLGRGGGKTTLCAAIACAAIVGPLVEPRAETLIVASSFGQGLIVFGHIVAFIRNVVDENRHRYRVLDSSNSAKIEDRETRASVIVLGCDPRRAHGRAPKLMLLDELAQWPEHQIDKMLAALRTSRGKIPGSKTLYLGTRPDGESHPFAKVLAGSGVAYSQVHAARPDDPPFHRRTWKRANPGLDNLPDLEAVIREEAGTARVDPEALAQFKALRLNQGTADHVRQVLLDAGAWQRIEGEAERAGEYVLGVDLGGTAAMSAAAAYWPSTGRLDALAAFPEYPGLVDRGRADAVGNLYVQMAARGELVTTGRYVSDVGLLLAECLERWGAPAAICADRWREGDLREALDSAAIPVAYLSLRGQGFKDGAEDVRLFRKACLSGRVCPLESLLLRAALREARVTTDAAGNAKLAKSTQGGRRSTARDDAAAAAILAVAEGERVYKEISQAAKPRYAIVG